MGRLRRETLAKLPDHKRVDLLDKMRDKIRELIKRGDFEGNPKDWYPATELVALAYAPGTSASLKFLCLKTASDLVHVPKAQQMKIDEGIGDTHVTVVVQPWAADIKRADVIVEPNAQATEPTHALIESQSATDSDD